MGAAVIDISKKINEKEQVPDKVLQTAERIKLMTVQAVLNAFETMGLSEVDRGYWWFHNTLNSAIQGFFEHNVGVMNVPPETKAAAEKWIKEKKEKLKKSKAVRVNQKKTEKEARALIIRINQEGDEPKKRKGRQNGQRKGKI